MLYNFTVMMYVFIFRIITPVGFLSVITESGLIVYYIIL